MLRLLVRTPKTKVVVGIFPTNTKLIKYFPTQRELKGLEARH